MTVGNSSAQVLLCRAGQKPCQSFSCAVPVTATRMQQWRRDHFNAAHATFCNAWAFASDERTHRVG